MLNDVILDPSQAPRVSEAAMNPGREEDGLGDGTKDGWDGTLHWMGPLSKLFSPGNRAEKHQKEDKPPAGPPLSKSVSSRSGTSDATNSGVAGGGVVRPRTMTVPKNAPALAASATTVNVEFLGGGVKNTFSSSDDPVLPSLSRSPTESHNLDRQPQRSISGVGGPKSVMDIFAGAPSRTLEPEPWVMLPNKSPRKARSSIILTGPSVDATGRSNSVPQPSGESDVGRRSEEGIMGGLSRYVDAVIDPVFRRASGQPDYLPTLPPPPPLTTDQDPQGSIPNEGPNQVSEPSTRRRLRRGLSDSSIQSTFTSQAADGERSYSRSPSSGANALVSTEVVPNRQPRFPAMWPDRQSVMQALTRTMQNFRLASSSKAGLDTSTTEAPPDPQPRSSPEDMREGRGIKANGKTGDPHLTPRKGLKIKSRDSTLNSIGVPYYANTVSGAMGTAALLNSLPGRGSSSMRDPFVWEP